jgi:hypothetical protein
MPDFRDTVKAFVGIKKGTMEEFVQMDAIAAAGWGKATPVPAGRSGMTTITASPDLAGGACLGYSALYLSTDSFSEFTTAAKSAKGSASVRGLANINYGAERSGAFTTERKRFDSYKQMLITLGLTYQSERDGTGSGGTSISSFMSSSKSGRYLVLLWKDTHWLPTGERQSSIPRKPRPRS